MYAMLLPVVTSCATRAQADNSDHLLLGLGNLFRHCSVGVSVSVRISISEFKFDSRFLRLSQGLSQGLSRGRSSR